MQTPILETERLLLRGYRAGDFASSAALWSDPAVNLYTTVNPLSAEEAWSKMVRNAGLWSVLGYGYWAVEEKSSGEFVGDVGFADFKRDIQPSIADVPELGYVLRSQFHGKGYATEAIRAALAWLEQHVSAKRTVAVIHEGNVASIRTAGKFGYREFARTQYKSHNVILFERVHPETAKA